MAKENAIDDAKLNSIIAEVTVELDSLLKTEVQKLSKARPGEDTTAETPSDASATDPTGEGTSTEPAAADTSPDVSASPAPDAGVDPSAPPAGAADASASGDPAAAGQLDPAALAAEYAKLPIEELKVHYLALKEVLVQAMGAQGGDPAADPAAAGAPPPAASPAPAGPAPGAAPAIKAEIGMKEDVKANGENPLHKAELDTLRTENAALKNSVDTLVKSVKIMVEAPLRKSVISVTELPAATPQVDIGAMTRDQVRAKLRTAASNPKLSKSDRQAIVDFDFGKIDVSKVAHIVTATK